MAAAAVSIDPSLYHSHSHHAQHSYNNSPYSQHHHHSLSALQQQQQQQHQHSHSHAASTASTPTAASLASALNTAGVNGMSLLSGMNAHSVNAIAAFRSQAATPLHANAASAHSHHNSGFSPFSTASTPSSFVPLYPQLYPMAQAAAVPLSSSSMSLSASASSSGFPVFSAGNGTSSLSTWPANASFHSSSHVSRVVTPDSSPSTPTHHFTSTSSPSSAWSDRLMPLTAHTFNMQLSGGGSDDYHMHSSKDDNSSAAHDGLSEHSSADKDDSSALSSSSHPHSHSHMLLSRSSQLNSRQLPTQATRDHVSRRRSSSNTSAASGGSAIDDKQLEALLKSIRLSVAKMDELIASSPNAAASTASIASTASASSTPSTSPVLRPNSTAALEDIKALLVNAANAVSSTSGGSGGAAKKRKSIVVDNDTAMAGDGSTDSPIKRRLTSAADDDNEDDSAEAEAGDQGFSVQEANGSGMADESDSEDDGVVFDDEDSPRTQCKPCPLVESINKKPLKVLYVNVQRQYTVSKKETLRMTKDDKERLVPVHVRIMGTPAKGELYFVAKDVCLLIHTRKGNVAKSIGQFREDEKVRMSVVCPRSNGTVSTHILTALTVKGVKRLLTTSRSPLAAHVLKWMMKQVDTIMTDYADEKRARQQRKKEAAAHASAAPSATAAASKDSVAMRKGSQDSEGSAASFNSNRTSPSTSPAASGLMSVPVVPLAPLSPLDVPSVTPLLTQEPSPIVKPSPLNYRLSPSSSASASQQLSVMVAQQQLLSQPDKKTATSSPSSPTRTTTAPLPSSLLTTAPSTSTSVGLSAVATSSSPSTPARSAFSKVPSFTADSDSKKGESTEAGRVSPTAALQKSADGTTAPSTGAVAAGGKSNAKLTSLLEAIKVQNVDGK